MRGRGSAAGSGPGAEAPHGADAGTAARDAADSRETVSREADRGEVVGPPALSAVAEDYLKAVWNAQEWATDPLTLKRLAQRLGVTPGTASEGVRRLAAVGLLDHERYGRVRLTQAGRSAALSVVRRHRLVETLLVQTFGYGWDEVHDEAEVLEHAISEKLLGRIDEHLGHPSHDPHGDPIPSDDGRITIPRARQLSELDDGACGLVTRVGDDDPELLQRLGRAGVVPGQHVRVVERDDPSALMVLLAGEPGCAPPEAPATPETPGGRQERDREDDEVPEDPPSSRPVPFGLPALRAVWVVPG